MMSQEEIDHAMAVKAALIAHPEWLKTTIMAAASGVDEAMRRVERDRSEWEMVAINAMEVRLFKDNKGWLAQKIETLKPRASFRWDHILERMLK